MYRQLRGIHDPEEFEARLKELEAEQEAESAALREAWEHFVHTALEAMRIPSIVSWLADKLERITGK